MQSEEEKQVFLRQEVLGQHIDAEKFMEYMGRVKNEGLDIDLNNWNMDEIKKVVSDFKAHLQQEIPQEVKIVRKANIFVPLMESKPQQVRNTVHYEQGGWDYQDSHMQQCAKLEKKIICIEGMFPYVEIRKVEAKSIGGFLFGLGAKRELELTLKTNFTENEVVRRCEDFDWLRETLAKKHPGCFIPPLKPYQQIAEEDTAAIAVRKAQLQHFINSLLKFQFCHYSRTLQVFFKELSLKRFNQIKQKQNLIPQKRDIDVVANKEGVFPYDISQKTNKYFKNTFILNHDIHQLFQAVRKDLKKVIQNTQLQAKIFRQLSHNCGQLNDRLKYLQNEHKEENFLLPQMFDYFKDLFQSLQRNSSRNAVAIDTFARCFLQPTTREWEEVVAHDRRRQNEVQQYLQNKLNLVSKKEKNYGDIRKWAVPEVELKRIMAKGKVEKEEAFKYMYPSENQAEREHRVWLAFFNHNYQQSIKTIIKEQEKELKSTFHRYYHEQIQIMGEINIMLQGFDQLLVK